jgi:dolichol-phosphate mannosyltransferase
MNAPQFSIVIPARNEADNLPDVVAELATALAGQSFEIVVVDDGSTDATATVLRRLTGEHASLRHIAHAESCGKSAAILTGVRMARAPMICTIDGDGQNDPRAIMPLLALASEEGVALAAGQRVKHAHSSLKRIGSKFANGLRSRLLHDNTRDTACGLKAFRRNIFLQLPYFDTMHRFLPALVLREGFQVRHLDVIDRPRRHGQSKYGVVDRALTGALDLIGVRWLIGRRKSVPQATEIPVEPS